MTSQAHVQLLLFLFLPRALGTSDHVTSPSMINTDVTSQSHTAAATAAQTDRIAPLTPPLQPQHEGNADWARCSRYCLCDVTNKSVTCSLATLTNVTRTLRDVVPRDVRLLNVSQCADDGMSGVHSDGGGGGREHVTPTSAQSAEVHEAGFNSSTTSQVTEQQQQQPHSSSFPSAEQAALAGFHTKSLSQLLVLDRSCNHLRHINVDSLPQELCELYLQTNLLTQLDVSALTSQLSKLEKLDLSDNQLQRIGSNQFIRSQQQLSPQQLPQGDASSSDPLNSRLSGGSLQQQAASERPPQVQATSEPPPLLPRHTPPSALRYLDLRANQISALQSHFLALYPLLQHLDLSSNRLDVTAATPLHDDVFSHCSSLVHLNLSNNPIKSLSTALFKDLAQLRSLHLRHLQIQFIHRDTFARLHQLQTLDLSFNAHLQALDVTAFSGLNQLQTLDLRHCLLTSLQPGTLQPIAGAGVYLAGNPFRCDCTLRQFITDLANSPGPTLYDDALCYEPPGLQGQSILQVNYSAVHQCTPATIINVTQNAFYAVGAAVVLDCAASSDAQANITWRTPSGRVLHHQPAAAVLHEDTTAASITAAPAAEPHESAYHIDHYWHNSTRYHDHQQLHSSGRRLHVLRNGSLYIDYVTRVDAGRYRCSVRNALGGDSAVIRLTLDYGAFLRSVWLTQLVGLGAAVAFLLFGLLIGLIRNLVSRSEIKNKEDSNRRIKHMLHTINDYKSAQMGRFSAYKSAKMDQLHAFKTSRMDRLHMPTLRSGLQHMHSMRDHYSAQIDVIRQNCTQNADRLRDNYALRMQRFRTYRSDKVGKLRGYKTEKMEALRDNYTTQAQRIREYGAQQMAKLRRSYRLQQHYLLKLYELLDIGNCMTVIEAECMRTESMLFDESFMSGLDLDARHPVDTHSDSDDSYYVTANSQSDESLHTSGARPDTLVLDVGFMESTSSDLGVDDLNFTDIDIQPFPDYLNFLDAIDMEMDDDIRVATADKKCAKEGKSKGKAKTRSSSRPMSLQLCVTPHKSSTEHLERQAQLETTQLQQSQLQRQQLLDTTQQQRQQLTTPTQHVTKSRQSNRTSQKRSSKTAAAMAVAAAARTITHVDSSSDSDDQYCGSGTAVTATAAASAALKDRTSLRKASRQRPRHHRPRTGASSRHVIKSIENTAAAAATANTAVSVSSPPPTCVIVQPQRVSELILRPKALDAHTTPHAPQPLDAQATVHPSQPGSQQSATIIDSDNQSSNKWAAAMTVTSADSAVNVIPSCDSCSATDSRRLRRNRDATSRDYTDTVL